MSCCCNSSAASTSVDVNIESARQAGSATTTYDVSGMTCGRCVASVTDEVEAVSGVTGVHVDLAAGQLTVEGDGPISATAVAAAVEKAGYRLTRPSASIAGAHEDASEHPIARAIAEAAREGAGQLPAIEDFANVEGLGVQGLVKGEGTSHAVLVGRPRLLAEWSQQLSPRLAEALHDAQERGHTAVALGWDGKARGVVVVADAVKATSREAITRLRALGLRPVLLTGDNAVVARTVAAEVGIDGSDVIAEVLPQGKVDVIARLQSEGRVVAMVGDGVNDAAALARADLGLAMGTGTDVAIEASDLTLVRGDLRAAADAIRLSRQTLGVIKTNLAWAFGYNIAALPLAAAGLLNHLVAGAAMAFSSVSVVANSLRLRRFSAERP